MNAEANTLVKRLLEQLIATGDELGLQVAAYKDG